MASSRATFTVSTEEDRDGKEPSTETTSYRPVLLTTEARPLRRSTPELMFNRERDSSSANMKTIDEYRVPYSRSFAGRTSSGVSKTSTISAKESRTMKDFIARQGSRTSLQSSTSTGLVVSDNVSSASSSQSRPVSADAEDVVQSSGSTAVTPKICSAPASSHPPSTPNTRFVLPVSRAFPHSPSNTLLPRSASIPSLVASRGSYVDKLVCRINSFLYMGDVEAAYNTNLLCRLNIGYVIDISNVEPLKIPAHKRSNCPCLCPSVASHSCVRMTLTIEENSSLDMIPYFDDVNRFIDSARKCNKCVLIHSYSGRNRCSVLVVQYLMKSRNISLERAVDYLRSLRPDVKIGENFVGSLRKWEQLLQQAQANAATLEDLSPTSGSCKQVSDGQPFVGPFNSRAQGTPTTKRSAWV